MEDLKSKIKIFNLPVLLKKFSSDWNEKIKMKSKVTTNYTLFCEMDNQNDMIIWL